MAGKVHSWYGQISCGFCTMRKERELCSSQDHIRKEISLLEGLRCFSFPEDAHALCYILLALDGFSHSSKASWTKWCWTHDQRRSFQVWLDCLNWPRMAAYFPFFHLAIQGQLSMPKWPVSLTKNEIKLNNMLRDTACSAQTIAKYEADGPLPVILNLSALTLSHLRKVMIPYEKHHSYEEKFSVFYFNIFKTVNMKCNFNTMGWEQVINSL